MNSFQRNIDLQKSAEAEGYAVGAFNVNNLEIIRSVVAAAEAERSPVIVAVTPSAVAYADVQYLRALAEVALAQSTVPIALHLDHGKKVEDCLLAIENGFSSVMIDGSMQSWETNVAWSKQVASVAHRRGLSVEGELGQIPSSHGEIADEVPIDAMTDPEKAGQFVAETGVDTLAVSVGNAHGWYRGRPKLDFDRLAEIRSNLEVPVVLHGASGIPDDDLATAIELGVSKVNIDTEIRGAFRDGVKEAFDADAEVTDPRKILRPAIEKMTALVRAKMVALGSSGKAD